MFDHKYLSQYHFWFLGVLLAFFLVAAIVYLFKGRKGAGKVIKPSRPSPAPLIGLFIITTTLSVLVNLSFKSYNWAHIFIFQFQAIKIPVYIGYFLLGIYANRKGWFESGYVPKLSIWGPLYILSSTAAITLNFRGPDTVLWKIAMDALSGVQIMTFLFTALSLAHKLMNKDIPILREITRSSYTVYLIHINILFMIVWMTRSLMLPSLIKLIIQALSTALICWVIAPLLVRIPGLRAVLDESGKKRV